MWFVEQDRGSSNGGDDGCSQRVGHCGTPIALDLAKKVMAAVEAKAVQNNWYVAISIKDSGPVMLHRLGGTQLVSIRIAEGSHRS
jgi:uncharacterized protein GlcG (DUF336 family)